MNTKHLVALACSAVATLTMAAGLDQLKGKMKEGMYEYKMEMDMGAMPGLPPGMGKQTMSFQKCLTAQDIEKGQMGKSDRKGSEQCELKNVNVSGNTATYTMICKQPDMTADNKIVYSGDGFVMDMNMTMNDRGQPMKMKQHMEGKYMGPCK